MYLSIQKEQGNSYSRQIYMQIREKILKGELPAGERLSSTRELSNTLNVSRNTVLTAYDMLISEGFLCGVSGSGVFVNEGIHLDVEPQPIADYRVTTFSADALDTDRIVFDSGTPALDLFPRAKWNKVASQAFFDAPVSAFGYDTPQGRPELRRVLAAHLKKTRGIVCDPEQILITTGAKQGLSLIAKCLLSATSEVWLEDPCNANVRKIFAYHTPHLTPIPVDRQGIRTELLPADRSPAFIFVTPSHQFPMGGILPIGRRIELIRRAQKANCYVVEDDYDSEFRYFGLPATSLHELDPQRVLYIGTFSKTLFPSLRLGYLVLPPSLVEVFREWKRLGDHHSNSLNQLALMRFLESGEYDRHVLRMKRLYARRRDDLIAELHARFSGRVQLMGEAAGMHVVADFAGVDFTPERIAALKQAGVDVIPVEEHAMIKGSHREQIVLGYAHLSHAEMVEGVSRIQSVLGRD